MFGHPFGNLYRKAAFHGLLESIKLNVTYQLLVVTIFDVSGRDHDHKIFNSWVIGRSIYPVETPKLKFVILEFECIVYDLAMQRYDVLLFLTVCQFKFSTKFPLTQTKY